MEHYEGCCEEDGDKVEVMWEEGSRVKPVIKGKGGISDVKVEERG